MKVVVTILLISMVAVSGCRFLQGVSVAQPSAEDTHACDVEAAHPEDLMRVAQGKADGEVVGMLALRACSEAVRQFPAEARFRFQRGRALLALRRKGEAAADFKAAAEMGYRTAKYYEALALLDSYFKSGGEDEYEQAIQLLTEIKEVFAPAAKRYDEVVFTLEGFTNPRIVKAFYLDDVARLNNSRILVAAYAAGMQKFLSVEYHPVGNECPAILVDSSINYDLDTALVGDPRNTLERFANDLIFLGVQWTGTILLDPTYKGDPEQWRDYYKDLGRRDAYHLVNKFGCESPVSQKVYGGLVKFAKAKRPLSEYLEELSKGRGKDLFLVAAEAPTEDEE